MSLRDLLGGLLPERDEGEIERSWREADDTFRELKEKNLQGSREREEELVSKTDELVDDLKDSLEAFDDYDDSQDLQIVEDVAQNLYRTRNRMCRNFEASDSLEGCIDDLEEFLDEFNDVSEKEGEVVKYVRGDSRELRDAMDRIMDHLEKMKDFQDTEYQVLKQLEMIEEKQDEIREMEEELEEVEKDLEAFEERDIREDIDELEQEVRELEETEEWREKQSLEREEDQLRKKISSRKQDIRSALADMDRGLKKLVYSIRNEGLDFEHDADLLESMEEHEISALRGNYEVPEEALEKVEEEDVLEGRDLRKFRDGVEALEDVEEKFSEIEELEEEKEDIEDRLEDIDVEKKREKIKQRKQNLEEDLEQKKDKAREVEEERDELQAQKHGKLVELEYFVNSLVTPEFKIKEIDREKM